MDQEYTPIISAEERAARRRQRAEARRRKQRARRRRQLCILVPCLAAAGLIIGGLRWPARQRKRRSRPAASFSCRRSPWGPPTIRDPEPTKTLCRLPDTFPSRCAVLLDAQSGIILAEKNADTVISPASMTKVLTVLVAAEQITEADLDETFTMTIDITDYCYVNGCSVVGLMVDETVSVRELFLRHHPPLRRRYAALGLATYVSGSQEAFVELMNAKLEELGLSDTAISQLRGTV